jgi:hypothetical protein
MKRRESLKSMLVGSVAGGLFVSACAPDEKAEITTEEQGFPGYGRTVQEKEHDREVLAEIFLNEHELETIAVLCDIILPATADFGSATDAKVPEFIEFIVKDMPYHQMPIRGGLAWLDNHSNAKFNLEFKKLTLEQQHEICDEIAFPGKTKPEHMPGEKLFTRMRNLTLTGYYTSEIGIKDLGYKGNMPNVWDGVPEDVLAKHSVSYEQEWLSKCIDQTKRGQLAQWDEDGNLIYS